MSTTTINKKTLSERDICTKLITPANSTASWDVDSQVLEEVSFLRIVANVQQLQQQLSQLEAQVQQSRQYAHQWLQSVLREAFEQKGGV